MALTEDTIIDSIEVLYDGHIQVRRANRVFRDGVEVSKTYHRHIVYPGQDLTRQDARVQAIARVVHTKAVIAAYQAAKAER